jgi:hypothetical protein
MQHSCVSTVQVVAPHAIAFGEGMPRPGAVPEGAEPLELAPFGPGARVEPPELSLAPVDPTEPLELVPLLDPLPELAVAGESVVVAASSVVLAPQASRNTMETVDSPVIFLM